MFRALRLGLRLKQATNQQRESIGAKAFARLKALKMQSLSMSCIYQDGSILVYDQFINTAKLLECDFASEDDWRALIAASRSIALPRKIERYRDASSNYRFEGWRFAYPPTCNAKYINFQDGSVIDLGAITA